jgi:hypothetical protein
MLGTVSLGAAARIGAIEAAIQRDTGRGLGPAMAAARGGLLSAARAIAALPRPRIGIVTGFFVPGGEIPAAETDGPVGAALLARALLAAGWSCRVATDAPCADACAAALRAADAAAPLDVAASAADIARVRAAWIAAGIDAAIAIERPGPTADGTLRNMRGEDIGTHALALDPLISPAPWLSIAVGDGGNEIGLGALPPALIADHVPRGAAIRCVAAADHLVLAGVSHWGALGLIAALAAARPDAAEAMRACLNADLDRAVLEATVADGPAVDGVTLRRAATIDGLGVEAHGAMLRAISSI